MTETQAWALLTGTLGAVGLIIAAMVIATAYGIIKRACR